MAGEDSPVVSSSGRAKAGSSGALKKRASGNASAGNSPSVARRAGGSTSTMMRMYTDDSPGLKVNWIYQSDPITVVVFSLMFIASVFILHIWGKLSRG